MVAEKKPQQRKKGDRVTGGSYDVKFIYLRFERGQVLRFEMEEIKNDAP